MAEPCKLTPDITKRIGDNIALGLTYALAAESAGITYQIFNDWMNKGKNPTSEEQLEFYKFIQKCNADAAKTILERLNDAAEAGNSRICMWVLERHFSEDFGRSEYRKMNVVSENQNETVGVLVKDADKIREEILEKFALVEKGMSQQLIKIV
jgi:hypothetical protein